MAFVFFDRGEPEPREFAVALMLALLVIEGEELIACEAVHVEPTATIAFADVVYEGQDFAVSETARGLQ